MAAGAKSSTDPNSTSSSGVEPQLDQFNVDKILIDVGITTPVNISNVSSATHSATSFNDDGSNLQHHPVPGQSRSMLKKYLKTVLKY